MSKLPMSLFRPEASTTTCSVEFEIVAWTKASCAMCSGLGQVCNRQNNLQPQTRDSFGRLSGAILVERSLNTITSDAPEISFDKEKIVVYILTHYVC